MKRPKATFLAIGCGIICAIAVFAFMQSVRGEAEASRAEALARFGGEQIEVCVAKRDIAPGETISETNIEAKLWVADLLPEGAVRDRKDAMGASVGTPILKGEVVSKKRFAESTATLDVPAGKCALSVPVKDVQAVGGAVGKGMEVDVYATGQSGTDLVAERVLVLSSNADGSSGSSATTSWATLAIDPESVQEIISASQRLELYLVLPGSYEEGGSR